MPSPDSSDPDNPTLPCEGNPDSISPNWQEAFYRVFLYLQALHVPKEKARELARETLRIASSNHRDTAESDSTRVALGVLRELLTEQLPLLRKELFSPKDGAHRKNLSRVSSMPPLNRGVMVPNAIDLIPWRTSLVNFLKKGVANVSRPFIFLIFFIFLIILFVLLTLWK